VTKELIVDAGLTQLSWKTYFDTHCVPDFPMPLTSQSNALKFGPFALDLQRGALFANGRNEIPLRPRSFALLKFLVEHSDVLISRETIQKTLWPDVFVIDDNITQCIGDIRRALGAAASEYLRTVPKRGYIFSGPKPERAPNGTTETASPAPVRRWITSMFTDLEGYTRLAERLEPEIYAPLLEEYLSQMIAIIHHHDGLLLGVMGDGLNVVFGVSTSGPSAHAARAVGCAFALDAFSEGLRARWCASGVRVGVTRIGIHSGPALVGRFGTQMPGGYSVHGETINIASRLEEANRILCTRICISGSTLQRAPNLHARVSGETILRDGRPAADVYEPLSAT
jgi:class 3 adenylate cyclase